VIANIRRANVEDTGWIVCELTGTREASIQGRMAHVYGIKSTGWEPRRS